MMLFIFSQKLRPYCQFILMPLLVSITFISYQVSLHALMSQPAVSSHSFNYNEKSNAATSIEAMEDCHQSESKSQCQSIVSLDSSLLPDSSLSVSVILLVSIIISVFAWFVIQHSIQTFYHAFLQRHRIPQISSIQLQLHSFLI